MPPAPGVLSAFGMLVAPVLKQSARTVLARGASLDDFALADVFRALEAEALEEMAEEGVGTGVIEVARTIDARYRGQSYELSVPADGDWVAAFHAAHAQRFGYAQSDAAIEAVTVRVEARAPAAVAADVAFTPQRLSLDAGTTPLVWHGSEMEGRLLDRAAVTPGLRGPAIIVEYSATTFLPPGWRVSAVSAGALLLEPDAA
jgi:N-methylhydantoinase A